MLASTALWAASFLVGCAGMEAVAHGIHRYVMHGPLWVIHRSHHERNPAAFERNDGFQLVFAAPSVALIYLGLHGHAMLLPYGLGIAAYGLCNWAFHDVLVHRRIPHSWTPRSGYLGRIVRAHHVHHATRTRDGAESFGFFYAPDYRKRPRPRRPIAR